MSARYVARAWRDEQDNGWNERPTFTVWETDKAPARTGLVDQHGTPILRLPDTVPLGFDLTPRVRR